MNPNASDHELLQAYRREHSHPAFAELVRRYVDLVYSAARRQVPQEHAARDVAQAVFVDLARQAARIDPAQPLAPWLYVVTRRTAIDYIRREVRRVERERSAAEVTPMNEAEVDWSRLEPMLDEAMASLDERDRAAVVLRYFQNRSLREVGAALGLSDDSAQKRVSRALDKLRDFFAARGVTVTAAGLATEVAARAVQVAPAGVAAAISAALPAAGLSMAGVVAGALARKAALGALAAAMIGGTVFQVRQHARARDAWMALAAEERALVARRTLLRDQREASRRRVQEIEQRLVAQHQESAAVELDAEVAAWFARVTRLKQLAAESPQWTVPEMRLLSDRNWFDLARDAEFDTDDARRELLKKLRDQARLIVGGRLRHGLVAYLDDHDGRLPGSVNELVRYLQPPLDPDILARYEMRAEGEVSRLDRDAWLIAERTVVDEAHGSRLGVGRALQEVLSTSQVSKTDFRTAVQAYVAAHPGALPHSAGDVLPYFTQPLTAEQREEFLKRPAKDFAPETLATLVTPN